MTNNELLLLVSRAIHAVKQKAHGPHTPLPSTADAVYKILLYSRFRKGALSTERELSLRNTFSRGVEARIRQNLPIQITLLGAPFKNQNPLKSRGRTLPDLAEIAFMLKLYSLHASVKTVYKPGIELILLHDGLYYAKACNISAHDAIAYRNYFKNLLAFFPAFSFIRPYELTDCLKEIGVEKAVQDKASSKARRWMESKKAATEVAAAYKKAIRSICPDDTMHEKYLTTLNQYEAGAAVTDKKIHRMILESVYEYKRKQIVIYEMKDPRPALFPDAIHASSSSYDDKLSLWLVERGRALLPWHGVGVLYKDGTFGVEYAETVHHDKQMTPVYLENEKTPFFYSQRL